MSRLLSPEHLQSALTRLPQARSCRASRSASAPAHPNCPTAGSTDTPPTSLDPHEERSAAHRSLPPFVEGPSAGIPERPSRTAADRWETDDLRQLQHAEARHGYRRPESESASDEMHPKHTSSRNSTTIGVCQVLPAESQAPGGNSPSLPESTTNPDFISWMSISQSITRSSQLSMYNKPHGRSLHIIRNLLILPSVPRRALPLACCHLHASTTTK
jgi:hypothetical protein